MKPAALLLLLAPLVHLAHLRLDGSRAEQRGAVAEALPTKRALDLTALGYRSLVADHYWLRLLVHFGDTAQHRARYPSLAPMLERIVHLDPHFASAYFFAGNALTLKGQDERLALAILEQGVRYRADDWRVPFLLGFVRFYHFGDYVGGAEALGLAASREGAPTHLGLLAARLSAEGEAPEVGIALIDSLLATVADDKLRAQYEERRRLLELEVYLRVLNAARERFVALHGVPPPTLEALVSEGILRALPPEPLGGAYLLAPDGRVVTTNEEQRLKLSENAKGYRP